MLDAAISQTRPDNDISRPSGPTTGVASPALPANYPSVQQRTPANTRRYAQRFPVRPAPVTGVAGTKPWRSNGGDNQDNN